MVKTVVLCGEDSCCPEVRIHEDFVEIGEGDNMCRLTAEEFEILKEKIINREI